VKRALVSAVFAIALAMALTCPGAALAQEADVGLEGPSFAGTSSRATAQAEESKAWWNDGAWWAVLWATAPEAHHVFRLDPSDGQWVDTGVSVDDRGTARVDVLWDGQHLYVSSHKHSGPTTSEQASRLYRLRYDTATRRYEVERGFPVSIDDGYGPGGLVIDKDARGRLWAAWVEDGKVTVNRTLCDSGCDDRRWGTPFVLPVDGADAGQDDVASLVAFGESVGVLWSNQVDGLFHFAEHDVAAPDAVWEPSVAIPGLPANNHVNMKADGQGRVFAVVKTSDPSETTPLIALLARDAATGGWSVTPVSAGSTDHTRPILLVDEDHDAVYVVAAGPWLAGTRDQFGQAIYVKGSAAAELAFPDGEGDALLRSSRPSFLSDPTSTKQPLDRQTGLVVLAADEESQHYWHNRLPLEAAPEPPAAEPLAAGGGDAESSSRDPEISLLPLVLGAFALSVGVSGALLLLRRGMRASRIEDDLDSGDEVLSDPRVRSPVALAAGLTIALWVVWGWLEGGFPPRYWGFYGAGLVLLIGITVAASPPPVRSFGRMRLVMMLALAAFVAWNFLSLLWADSPGKAWFGADKTMLYAAGFLVFAAWPWTSRDRLALLGLFGLGVTTLGAIVLARATIATDPSSSFDNGQLIAPTGYSNGSTALWMLAFWPAAHLASTRVLRPPLRALYLAAAVLLVALSVLGQSRGWLFVTPVAAGVWLLVSRDRLRTLLALGLVAACVLPVVPALLDVYEKGDNVSGLAGAVDRAGWLVLAACGAAAAIGLGWGLLDARVRLSSRARHTAAICAVGVCIAGLVVGGVRFATAVDDPGDWVAAKWEHFSSGDPVGGRSVRLTGSLSSNRAQEWHIAWLEFVDHPVVGIGSDNYAAAYLLRRTDNRRQPDYPHSTPLRLLSQLGIVGSALFALFAAMAILLAVRVRNDRDGVAGGVAAAALTVFAYWFLHGSLDVFWEVPALGAAAFGMLGLAGAMAVAAPDVLPEQAPPPPEEDEPPEPPDPDAEPAVEHAEPESAPSRPRHRRALRIAGISLGAAVVLAATASLVMPWLSSAYERAGLGVAGDDPVLAYERLDRAAALNPLSADPLLVKGSIALRRRDTELARDSFQLALKREPTNWFAHLQLALVAAVGGNYDDARVSVASAQELNPRDPVVEIAAELIERREPVDPELLNRLYAEGENRLSLNYLLNTYFGGRRFDEPAS
jgi:hypothetical protein